MFEASLTSLHTYSLALSLNRVVACVRAERDGLVVGSSPLMILPFTVNISRVALRTMPLVWHDAERAP